MEWNRIISATSHHLLPKGWHHKNTKKPATGWWFFPTHLKNMLVQIGNLPQISGRKFQEYLSCHHLGKNPRTCTFTEPQTQILGCAAWTPPEIGQNMFTPIWLKCHSEIFEGPNALPPENKDFLGGYFHHCPLIIPQIRPSKTHVPWTKWHEKTTKKTLQLPRHPNTCWVGVCTHQQLRTHPPNRKNNTQVFNGFFRFL